MWGHRGELEQKFLDAGRTYVAWGEMDVDLAAARPGENHQRPQRSHQLNLEELAA
jgi:hypothetical protein